MDRNTITKAYARVCRDSGFSLNYDQAAALVSSMLGIHPLEVWTACGCLDNMQKIADGTHPHLHLLDAPA